MGTPAYLLRADHGRAAVAPLRPVLPGIVLYQMLTVVPPFDAARSPPSVRNSDSRSVEPSRRNPALLLASTTSLCAASRRSRKTVILPATLWPHRFIHWGAAPGPGPRCSAAESFLVGRASQSRDVWAFAFGNFAGGGSVPAGRAVVSHFRLAAAPAAIASFAAPKAPEALAFYAAEEEIQRRFRWRTRCLLLALPRQRNSDRATLPDFR